MNSTGTQTGLESNSKDILSEPRGTQIELEMNSKGALKELGRHSNRIRKEP